MRKNFPKFILFGLIASGSVLLLYRQASLSQMPDALISIPQKIEHEVIPVPRRPGTKSIRIVGPPLQVLKFQIDFTQNPLPIDWRFLERTDKRADVMVEGRIDNDGNFNIRKIRDRGHPQAGHYIRNVLSSWKFKQYKKGTIRYYFNVPTRLENMKIQIDTRGLNKNRKHVRQSDFLKNGILCYAVGISRKNIKVIQ